MKKIFVLLLAIACAFTMFSCGEEKNDLKAFTTAIAATNPTEIEVETKFETAFGTLEGWSKTTITENGATIEYWKDVFNATAAGENASLIERTPTATVTRDASGNYSDNGAYAEANGLSTGAKLTLDAKKMTYTVSPDGNVLSATILAADTEAVLGVAIDADVSVVLTKNAESVISFTVTYATTITVGAGETEATVEIVCNYR